MTNREGFLGREPSLLQVKVPERFRAKPHVFAGVLGDRAVPAIAQDGVERDVGHFRVAAGGDEASGGIGNKALKASPFAQHVLVWFFVVPVSFICEIEKTCV